MVGRSKLTFDWANARAKDGALWVDCHDGSNIVAKISQGTIDAAVKAGTGAPLHDDGNRRLWLESAIRRRYIATRPNGRTARKKPDDLEILIVGKEDFA